MGEFPQISTRAVAVISDIDDLTAKVKKLESGLDDRHLRIVSMWHYGLSDAALFPKSTLRVIGFLSYTRDLWTVAVRLGSRTYELVHEPTRPPFPIELAQRMVLETQTSRDFQRELERRLSKMEFTIRRPEGTIEKRSAYLVPDGPHLINPKSEHPGGKPGRPGGRKPGRKTSVSDSAP